MIEASLSADGYAGVRAAMQLNSALGELVECGRGHSSIVTKVRSFVAPDANRPRAPDPQR